VALIVAEGGVLIVAEQMGFSRFTTSAASRIWIDPDIQSE